MVKKTKHQLIAALILLDEEMESSSLLETVSDAERGFLEEAIRSWSELDPKVRPSILKQFIRTARTQEEFAGIGDIHPAWLLEPLKKESPRVIGVILRHMPSKHVRYILERLPRRTVEKMPQLVEAFCVPREILSVVRHRFEKNFLPFHSSRSLKTFDFSHLYYLRNEELDLLFRELGMSELALSLSKMSKKIVRALLHRFSVSDAKGLVNKIKDYQSMDKRETAEAQYTVLELVSQELGQEKFLRELGIAALAKGFTPGSDFLYQSVKQKLDPAQAYLLKRYIDLHAQRGDLILAKKRQKWVLDHISRLSEEVRIDKIWHQYLVACAA